MARVPYVNREDLDGEGQEIYDRIRRDRNSETVGLQFRALLHNPQAAGFLTSMGAQLRFKSALPEALKEFAASKHLSYTEAVRRAIAIAKYIDDEISEGRKVQTVDPDRADIRELILI